MQTYSISRADINVIVYMDNLKIQSFNPYSGRGNNGIIEQPIVELYNGKVHKNQMLNYVSGQYYMLKIVSDTPYEEISPLLMECGLDGIILQTTNISNVFNNSISNITRQLVNDLILLVIYLISICILIIYNCRIYFSLYKKNIAYKRLGGFGLWDIYKVSIMIQFFEGLLFWGLSFIFLLIKLF